MDFSTEDRHCPEEIHLEFDPMVVMEVDERMREREFMETYRYVYSVGCRLDTSDWDRYRNILPVAD